MQHKPHIFHSGRPLPAKRGITLIEAIVSITIVAVATAGPLTLAARSLKAASEARNEFIATHLAEEGIEVLLAIRNNNSADDDPKGTCPGASCRMNWLVGDAQNRIWNICGNAGPGCIIDVGNQAGAPTELFAVQTLVSCSNPCSADTKTRIYQNTASVNPTGLYAQRNAFAGPPGTWTATPFSRWIQVTRPNDTNNPPTDEILITSTVTYPGYGGGTRTVTQKANVKNWFPYIH